MGRDRKEEGPGKDHGTFVRRKLLETDAWRALSNKSRMLYIWLRMEWKGTRYNNNGRIRLSCRQAGARLGCSANTAMRGFHELQAKGFIVVTKLGALGVEGEARGPSYELTELASPGQASPKLLYREWRRGHDFEVARHPANNPKGHIAGCRTPSQS